MLLDEAAAIRFAAGAPRRVRGLVLENPGGLAAADDLAARLARAMAGFFAAGSRRAWWFPAAFALYYRTVLQRRSARVQRQRIVASAYEIAPVLAEAWRSFAAPEADIRSLASSVECPVLFAWASRDQLVSLSRSRAAIERFPRARLVRFPAGHAPHLETPRSSGGGRDAAYDLRHLTGPGGGRQRSSPQRPDQRLARRLVRRHSAHIAEITIDTVDNSLPVSAVPGRP